MIKKSKLILLVILVALATVSLIAGCKIGKPTADELKQEYNLKAQVTYFANGGTFEDSESSKTLYYQPNSVVLEIGKVNVTSSEANISKFGYELIGWYEVETEEVDGKIVPKTVDGEIVYGEKMDFTKKIQEGDHLYLCAVWEQILRVNVLLAGTESITVGENVYTLGKEISYYSFDSDNKVTDPGLAGPVKASDATFLQFYKNAECTEVVEWPIQKPTNGEHVVIYGKFISGNWTVLRTAKDVENNFGALGTKSLYLVNDIDCQGARIEQDGFNVDAKIQGNGFTISNFTLYQNSIVANQFTTTGLFGRLGDNAVIENVNFENVTVRYSVKSTAVTSYLNIYAFCTEVSQNAVINNVSVSVKMVLEVPPSASITNIYIGENTDGVPEGYKTENWLFGGLGNDSAMQGVTLDTQNSGCYIVTGKDANNNDQLNQII